MLEDIEDKKMSFVRHAGEGDMVDECLLHAMVTMLILANSYAGLNMPVLISFQYPSTVAYKLCKADSYLYMYTTNCNVMVYNVYKPYPLI